MVVVGVLVGAVGVRALVVMVVLMHGVNDGLGETRDLQIQKCFSIVVVSLVVVVVVVVVSGCTNGAVAGETVLV